MKKHLKSSINFASVQYVSNTVYCTVGIAKLRLMWGNLKREQCLCNYLEAYNAVLAKGNN